MSEPKVTVVIPCRNEVKFIGQCLSSLVESDFPKEQLEVLVCDGMSDDGTREVIAGLMQKHSGIRMIDNPRKIAPVAMNLGIRQSNAGIIIILGAHTRVYPDFISNCVIHLSMHPEADCVGGIIESVCTDERSEAISAAMSSPFGVGNAYFRTGNREGYVDTVAYGAYRKSVFDRVGLFDERLVRNQDDEFNYRVTKSGGKILLKKDIRSKYFVRYSFRKLFSQYFQYGYWKVIVNRMHRTVTTVRQLVPFLFVVFLLGGIFFSFFSRIVLGLFLAVLIVYILLSLAFALTRSQGMRSIPLIMLAFYVLHLSYGTGYLVSLLNPFRKV